MSLLSVRNCRFQHFLLRLLLLFPLYTTKVNYRGCKVYSVRALNRQQLSLLHSLQELRRFDFWTSLWSHRSPVDVMVSAMDQPEFEKYMRSANMSYDVKFGNVENLLRKEVSRGAQDNKLHFDHYYTYSEIESYLGTLALNYTSATVESYGTSFEGRTLRAIVVSKNGGANRPMIMLDGGTHAREWISVSVCLYIVNQLLEVERNGGMIEHVDWLIVPVVNPDGYVYTHTTERLWRKNRSIVGKEIATCIGVDLNRNWNFHWGETGSSDNPCTETYAGSRPFSEPETRALAELAQKYAGRIGLYISFHSYGQYILHPWSFSIQPVPDVAVIEELGRRAIQAISAVRGSVYQLGSSAALMYPAAGCSDDYMKGVLGVRLAYTIELSGGTFSSFIVPNDEIEAIVAETFEGIRVFHNHMNVFF